MKKLKKKSSNTPLSLKTQINPKENKTSEKE